MALKILMVSRFNSDFERWVSLARIDAIIHKNEELQ